MTNTKCIRQGWVGSFVITKNSLMRIYLGITLAAGLIIALPAMSAPVLELPPDFAGVFGVEYPVINPVYNIDEGDPATTDYLYEWVILTRDSSGTEVASLLNSRVDFIPLDSSIVPSLFPTAGDYTLELSMTTFHQLGGLLECGPNSGCFDNTKPSSDLVTSDTMNVRLLSAPVLAYVPVPAAVWLFGSGLIGLVGLARRKARP
jgi:hypothetical protein